MSFQVCHATPADFAAILALQDLNHARYLPDDAREDGFLTTWLDTPKLEYLAAQNGLFVAKTQSVIAGYLCSESWDLSVNRSFHERVATLFPLLLNAREITAHNSRLYGPVCIASPFRGQNALPLLLEAFRTEFSLRFEFAVTFIDHRNARSLAAHERKLGFAIVSQLPYEDATYHVLALNL